MVISDPIGDMLTRVRNAAMAHKKVVELPSSKLKVAVANLLVKEGYLARAEEVTTDKNGKTLRLTIVYEGKEPYMTGIKRVSKPGLRWYVTSKKIPVVMGGMGVAILSTPMGIMSGKEARAKGVGGELLCEIW
jgi:small subunit ribosomal protein S8